MCTGASAKSDVNELERRLGHGFTDSTLLARALSHRSWVAESDDDHSNERLEFLGDAVLGWVVADIAFRQFVELPEGDLTDLRKSVVNATALAEVASELRLGDHLLLGKGEDAAGGREKVSIMSDAMEAVLGAVYLDAGADAAYRVIARLFSPRIQAAVDTLDQLDHKSALQELCARRGLSTPSYVVDSEGPDHEKVFTAAVLVDSETVGRGVGRSKKAAEQAAADKAFAALTDD